MTADAERAATRAREPELDAPARGRRRAAWCGFAAVAGNLLGVAFLRKMPSAYRLARLDEWASAVKADPASTIASGLCFAGGLAALAVWARELGQSAGRERGRKASSLIAATALSNAAGSLLPLAAALGAGHGRALLRTSLTLDALFNLGLGVGLLGIAADRRNPPSRRVLALAAGGASVPVAGQAVWDGAASILYVAAPLWLLFIALTSRDWLRSDAAAAR